MNKIYLICEECPFGEITSEGTACHYKDSTYSCAGEEYDEEIEANSAYDYAQFEDEECPF